MKRILKADVFQMIKEMGACPEGLETLARKLRTKASFAQIWKSFVNEEFELNERFAGWLLSNLGYVPMARDSGRCTCGEYHRCWGRTPADMLHRYPAARVLRALVRYSEKRAKTHPQSDFYYEP